MQQLTGERWDELDAAQLGEGSLAYQPPECHEGAKTARPGYAIHLGVMLSTCTHCRNRSRENSEAAMEAATNAALRSSGSKRRKKKKPSWMKHPYKVQRCPRGG